MKIQLLEISTSDNEDSGLIHCMFCGHQQDPENTAYCEHVSFVYLRNIGEFDYVAPWFQAEIDNMKKIAKEKNGFFSSHLEEQLLSIPSNSSNFIVELSSSGMACGPSSFTVLYGFDA